MIEDNQAEQHQFNNDAQWEGLAVQWQQAELNQLSEREIPTDQVLLKNVKAQIRISAIEMLFGILGALLLIGLLASEIINGLPSVYDTILYYGLISLISATLIISVWIMRDNWKTPSKDTNSYLSLLLKRIDSQIKINYLLKYSCAASFLLFCSLIAFLFFEWLGSDHSIAKPVMALSIITAVMILFPSMYYMIKKRKNKLEAKKQKLINMLSELERI